MFLPVCRSTWDPYSKISAVPSSPEQRIPVCPSCPTVSGATHQDVELLQRRRDIIARELRGIRQVHLAVFTSSPTIKDRKLAEQIKQEEVLHLCGDELLRSD